MQKIHCLLAIGRIQVISKKKIMYDILFYLSGNYYKIVEMDVRVASPTFSEKKTALTSTERKHKHRANLTDEQKAAIQEKDAARKRLKRASERLTPKQIKDSRAADAA